MIAYRHIVFMQGEEAYEVLDLLHEEGVEACIDHLAEWDNGDGEVSENPPWGTRDELQYGRDGYVLSYNTYVGSVSLTCEEEDDEVYCYG